MLVEISTNELTQNVFHKNYPKIIIQLLYLAVIRFNEGDIINAVEMKNAIIQAAYSSFKGQIVVTEFFRKGFGELEKDVLIKTVLEMPDGIEEEISAFD